MVEFTIRPATSKDFQAIRTLIHAVHINPIGLDWRHFLVAVTQEDVLLGCGQIKIHSDGSHELASIAVKVNTRRQGIARAIIQELCKRETSRPLFLMCRAKLESFYNKFGFCTISINNMPPYFQRICRAERVFNAKARQENRLSVMRLD